MSPQKPLRMHYLTRHASYLVETIHFDIGKTHQKHSAINERYTYGAAALAWRCRGACSLNFLTSWQASK